MKVVARVVIVITELRLFSERSRVVKIERNFQFSTLDGVEKEEKGFPGCLLNLQLGSALQEHALPLLHSCLSEADSK